jgi:DNA-binding NarL/FixJ family response regulator
MKPAKGKSPRKKSVARPARGGALKSAAVPAKKASPESVPQPARRRRYKIILVEDHPIVRQGLAQIINLQPDLEVVGEADGPGGALDLMRTGRPDLMVLDVSLPKGNGLELIKQIKAECPRLATLVVSMHDETLYAERALRAGASGYVMKKEPSAVILSAIRSVLDGAVYLSERMNQRVLHQAIGRQPGLVVRSAMETLSDRELQVFQLIGNGFGTRQIAEHLHLSIKTIESYRMNLKEKLSLNSGIELTRHAVQWAKVDQA